MPERGGAETRRSSRVTLRVPLKIYERGSGGLIALGATVDRDQKLFVFNQATGETAESEVLYLRPMRLAGGLGMVAIKFLKPSPGFWGVAFPTVDPCRSQTREYPN